MIPKTDLVITAGTFWFGVWAIHAGDVKARPLQPKDNPSTAI
jgi:hypothetical protein